jgi:hypothetical protein
MNRTDALNMVQGLCTQCGSFQTNPGSDPLTVLCTAGATGCLAQTVGDLALAKKDEELKAILPEDILTSRLSVLQAKESPETPDSTETKSKKSPKSGEVSQ